MPAPARTGIVSLLHRGFGRRVLCLTFGRESFGAIDTRENQRSDEDHRRDYAYRDVVVACGADDIAERERAKQLGDDEVVTPEHFVNFPRDVGCVHHFFARTFRVRVDHAHDRTEPGIEGAEWPVGLQLVVFDEVDAGVDQDLHLGGCGFWRSVASVAALAAAVQISTVDSVGFVPSLGLALAVSGAVGLLNGVMVQLVGINAFIVTLGTLTAVRGLVLVVTDGRSLMVQGPGPLAAMTAFESGRLGPIPYPVLYRGVFTLAVWFALHCTVFGRRIYAVGGNAEAARLSGINVRAYKMGAFVLSSVAAGFAGVLFGCRFGAINPTALQGEELTVIAAAILGALRYLAGRGASSRHSRGRCCSLR